MRSNPNAKSSILKSRILTASSEETDYPASNLLVPKKGNKCWQCKRFCTFPQELIFAFPQPSQISSMQLLSHQSKISSKIDIYVSRPDSANFTNDISGIQFKKIGYFMLSSNEKSNYQSRELKTVYIDSPCNFIKLVLHKPHTNAVNLFYQIGVIAVIFFGSPLPNSFNQNNKYNTNTFNINTGMQAMSRPSSIL